MTPYYEDESVTLWHGDCRDVLPRLSGLGFALSDAPYNAGFDYGDTTDDLRDWDAYAEWLGGVIESTEAAVDGPVLLFVSVAGAMRMIERRRPSWAGAWVRPAAGNPAGSMNGTLILPTWEPCLMYGDMRAVKCSLPDVWRTNVLAVRNGHPCPKPVELMRAILDRFPTDLPVLDTFAGSGTTLVAAKQLGRKSVGIEINEAYCEIAAKRLAQGAFDFGEAG